MCQCHDIERGDLPLRKKGMVRLGWWDMPQECCPTERKNITTGFCVALTAEHEQFFLSGCPSLLSQGVQWIQMWGIRQLAVVLAAQGKTLATAGALSRSPSPEGRGWLIAELTVGLLGVWYQPQIRSWLKPAQQSRLMKHDQRSSALQDTE